MATVLEGLSIAQSFLDEVPNRPLAAAESDATLLAAPLTGAAAVVVDAGELAGRATFVIAAGAELIAQAFNSADDVDADGILASAQPESQPLIPFDATRAWLKHRVDARARAAAGGALGALGFHLDAGAAGHSLVRADQPGEGGSAW